MEKLKNTMNRKQENWAVEAVPYLVGAGLILWTAVGMIESGIDVMGVANSVLNHVSNVLSTVVDKSTQLIDGYDHAPSLDLYTAWLKGQNPGIEIAETLSRTNPDVIDGTQRAILALMRLGK
ncbi:hypothetical protein KBD69_02215 [Candidatus Woesebacteria bacterium]|nr:hypothetical protein [Candidatus Woesebacteria bacterium]